ncbi:hypothetical protein LguiA_009024 [Lonicera macranthoides]
MSSNFSGDETAPFFGFLGAAAALVFSCMGAAYGTTKSGVGVASMGVMRPELVMKSIVPVVMAGLLGIHGLIIAVIISTGINPKAKSYYLFDGYAHLSSGLACGLAGLSAGMAIGIVGDAGVRANAQQPKLFVGMILISSLPKLWLYMDSLLASSCLHELASHDQTREMAICLFAKFSCIPVSSLCLRKKKEKKKKENWIFRLC